MNSFDDISVRGVPMKMENTSHALIAVFMSLSLATVISGCTRSSSDSDTSTLPSATSVGVLVDSPVAGVSYSSPSASGVTNSEGEFNYADDQTVEFSFGQVKLGGSRGQGVITPMDLMSADYDSEIVKAMASFLQSLDADGSHGNGIQLNDDIANLLNGQLAGSNVDFSQILSLEGDGDSATSDPVTDALGALDTVVQAVVTDAANDGDDQTNLVYVDPNQAATNLAGSLEDSWIFRKNISKTPEYASAKAKMNIMPVWVPARQSDDSYWKDDASLNTADGLCTVTWNGSDMVVGQFKDSQCWSKPLVVTYTDIDFRYGVDAAADAFGAISRDDGLTWKRANLARTGERDVTSATSGFPVGFKGESRKPVMQVKNNYILVAWTDKYCNGGQPAYSLTDDLDNRIYEDLYGVSGSQGFLDYSEQLAATDPRMPSPSIVPYSCLWASRGVVDAATGDIQWYMPERITSGRRDAYQVFVGAAPGGGMAVTWQEDPEGLQAGSAKGPGDGMSGATASHKTDVWYSYIPWGKFAAVDTDFVPKADDPDPITDDPDTGLGRVKALNPISMPVRITDNDSCNADNMFSDGHKWCLIARDYSDNLIYPDALTIADIQAQVTAASDAILDLGSYSLVNCASMVNLTAIDPKLGYTCVTEAGSVLDGDSGATRPNLFLQKDLEGKTWAILAYEETKGRQDVFFSDGTQAVLDDGKNVVYHSFAYNKPDLISAGSIVNMPERDAEDNLIVRWCQDDLGGIYQPTDGACATGTDPLYARENSRRIRFVLQGEGAVKSSKTVLMALWKEGVDGKGAPSDIMSRRMEIGDAAANGANPYAFSNFVCDELDSYGETCIAGSKNMSSPTTLLTEAPTQIEPIGDSLTICPKLAEWEWTVDDLDSATTATICDDSRAHRGQIRGNFIVMGYSWTPNWAAARNGNDKYDLYIRRSFDGGKTWTTNPAGTGVEHCEYVDPDPLTSGDQYLDCSTTIAAGDFEPPRNVSLLRNNKQSVIEPRIVAVPGAVVLMNDANADGKPDGCADKNDDGKPDPCFPEDKPNTNIFISAYGLANNSDTDVDGELNTFPTDMYFAKSQDKGESYLTVSKCTDDGCEDVWPWLAKRADVEEGEAQWRITPDGSRYYASWLSESPYNATDHFSGSDIWFRKIDNESYSWGPPELDSSGVTEATDTETGDDL